MTFDEFSLHATIAANVRDLGYTTPSPIQARAIPPALQGNDLIGLAQTGTGKTAAFALPILQRLLTSHTPSRTPGVRALILAPTRELAEQIHESFGKLARHTRLRSVAIYGGVGITPQITKLRAGVEIVVACPGRLLDHLAQRTIDLSRIEFLVLDEADRMLDMGFLPDIRRILKQLPTNRQTMLFSATMPDDIRGLTGEALRNPQTIQIDAAKPTNTVSHGIYPVKLHQKTDLLLELLRRTETESVLVFTSAKHRAKRLAEKLEKSGYTATSLQGNLSQNRRQEALNGFRDGKFQILVATDVAARGIDVASISHVINFDMPDTLDAYTHRIGRTGRAAKTGDAFTFVTDDDHAMVRTIENALGTKLARHYVPDFDYNAPAPPRDPSNNLGTRPSRSSQGGPRQRHPQAGGPPASQPTRSRPASGNTPAGTTRPRPAGNGNSNGWRSPGGSPHQNAGPRVSGNR